MLLSGHLIVKLSTGLLLLIVGPSPVVITLSTLLAAKITPYSREGYFCLLTHVGACHNVTKLRNLKNTRSHRANTLDVL